MVGREARHRELRAAHALVEQVVAAQDGALALHAEAVQQVIEVGVCRAAGPRR
jgi:hypothetical protein